VRIGGACIGSFYFLFRKEPEAFARLEALPDRFFIVFAMNCQFQTEEGKYERVSMPSIRSDRSFSATGPSRVIFGIRSKQLGQCCRDVKWNLSSSTRCKWLHSTEF
jgi:hypothetical protein